MKVISTYTTNWLLKLTPALIAVLFLLSCEEPNDIGLDLLPDQDQIDVTFLEIPLESSIVWFDSVNSTNGNRALVGSYTDGDFGKVSAGSHLTITLDNIASRIASTAIYDSMRLELETNYRYGNAGSTANLNLHFLEDTLDVRPYYRFEDVPNQPAVIGSTSYTFPVSSTIDSLLSIKIDDAIGLDWFNRNLDTTDSTFANQTSFQTFSKGFALESDIGTDVILGINVNAIETRLVMYYHFDGDEESTTYKMYVGNNANVPTSYHFNSINSDFAGSELAGQPTFTDFNTTSGDIFLQAGVGFLPKIDLTQVLDLNGQFGNFLINRADLVVDNVRTFEANEELPPNLIQLFYVRGDNRLLTSDAEDEVGNFLSIQTDGQAQTSTLNPTGINYDINNNFYRGSITSFVQALLDGTIQMDNPEIYLLPTSFSESVNRFRVGKNDIKLRIYYTTLN